MQRNASALVLMCCCLTACEASDDPVAATPPIAQKPVASRSGPMNPALVERGKAIFRFDTFGDETFWTDSLRMHEVIRTSVSPKAALGLGGQYGRGYVSCRNATGTGWSVPGSVRIEGGSVGLQIGAAETDVILLVLNDRGADRLLSSRFTVGADAGVAAGPVGRQASAQTDATLTAEILAWSRSRGVYAGLALQGWF